MPDDLAYDLDSLAVDVFNRNDFAAPVESLTGHGVADLAASCIALKPLCSGSCAAT
jgi:hypothetical protein